MNGTRWTCAKLLAGSAALVFIVVQSNVEASNTSVGVFKDGRSGKITGVSNTLVEAGMSVTVLSRGDLQDMEKLEDIDVIYVPGGWESGDWLGEEGLRVVLDFVAHGKGVLASAFRSGPFRNTQRPMFPEVAQATCKTCSNYVLAKGRHPLLKGFSGPFCHRSWDHIILDVGPEGEVFLTDVDDNAVGACGETLNGRYVALGIFSTFFDKEPLTGDQKALFLNCIRWLADSKRLAGKALEDSLVQAELHYRRQKLILDYTRNEKGPDMGAGIIPMAKYMIQTPLDALRFRLQYQEQWLTGADLKQAASARTKLDKTLSRLESNYEKIVKNFIAGVNRMPLEALCTEDVTALVQNMDEKLLPAKECETIVKQAETLLAKFQPKVAAAKAKRDAKAREADLAAVPGLLEQCKSDDYMIRRQASTELGRIGDKRAIPTLMEMIDDQDELVRRNAVLALGWMQASEAVPRLIKATQSKDKWLRRRAVQALGLIGDRKATPVLLPLIRHEDPYTAENAIFALGWLRDSAATQPLLDLLKELDPDTIATHDRMCSIVRALGHIGDPKAIPVLENLAATAKDFPGDRRGNPLPHLYFTEQRSGLEGYSKLALEEISQKKGKPGITQPDYLRLARYFYGIRDRFNFWAARPCQMWSLPQFAKDPVALLDYAWSGGATGYNTGWGQPDFPQPELLRIFAAMDDRDQRIITDMPLKTPIFGKNKPLAESSSYAGLLHKAGCERDIMFCADSPAFGGFWSEERYPEININDEQFELFLKEKYGADYRVKMGLGPDAPIGAPPYDLRFDHRKQWIEYCDAAGQRLIEDWRESQEWLHGLRKECAFTFSISSPYSMVQYLGVCPRAGAVIDVHGPEIYSSHASDNVFIMELLRDGESRPVMCEFYNTFSLSPEYAEHGYATHLVHGESYFGYFMGEYFPQPPTYMWTWDKARWPLIQKIFTKARKIRDYLSPTRSVANVALIYSDRTSLLFSSAPHNGRAYRYYQHQAALWDAFRQSHIPLDAIWAETLTAEKLARYKALILSDAKSLAPNQVGLIREWVRDGGVLLASGTTTLFNQWGEQEKNYQLTDLFGVSYKGHVVETDPAKVDTYGFVSSRETHVQLVNEGLDPQKVLRYVHREIKPEKSVVSFDMESTSSSRIPGVKDGMECEVDMAFGYDRVAVAKATVLAKWANGDPAVTMNKFGKGCVLFMTPVYPGLSYCGAGWEEFELYKNFWPGMREVLGGLILAGLKETATTLPVESAGLPGQVEVSVKGQPEHNRWMIHLLNYDPKLDKVGKAELTVHLPESANLRVFYPDTGEDVKFDIDGAAIKFTTRPFGVHDMVVVEYSKKEVSMNESDQTNTAVVPVPKLEEDFYDWYARHDQVKALIEERSVDMVFMGCSIMHIFGGEPESSICRGKETWDKYYARRNPVNMGFGYDRTQNVLWRLQNGEFDGISPKVVVLLIGSNNLKETAHARQNSPSEIADGVKAVCKLIHQKAPECNIILLGILPRRGNSSQKSDVYVKPIRETNKLLSALDNEDYISFIDLKDKFADAYGLPKRELLVDEVHPNARGYQVIAESIEPTVAGLMGDE